MFDGCFEQVKPALAMTGNGFALKRLVDYVVRATDFLCSEDGKIMARLVTGIYEDKKLQRMFLDRYAIPRRRIQGDIIKRNHRGKRTEARHGSRLTDQRSQWPALLSVVVRARASEPEIC